MTNKTLTSLKAEIKNPLAESGYWAKGFAVVAVAVTVSAAPASAGGKYWSSGFGDPVQAMTSAKAATRYTNSLSQARHQSILASIGRAKRKGVIGYVFRENKVNRTRIRKSNRNISGIIKNGNVGMVSKTSDGYSVTYTNGGGSKTIMPGGGCAGQGCN